MKSCFMSTGNKLLKDRSLVSKHGSFRSIKYDYIIGRDVRFKVVLHVGHMLNRKIKMPDILGIKNHEIAKR